MLSPCPSVAAHARPRTRAAVLALAAALALAGPLACGGAATPEAATEPASQAAAPVPVELNCDDRSALAPDEATALAEAASRTLRWVREGELELLWGSLHPQARHPEQRDAFGTAIASVGERLGRASPALNVLDVRRIRVRGTATGAQEVACPATPANEALTWFGNVGDEDVAVVIVEARIDPFLEAAVVQLRRHADEWRLVGLSTSPSAYRGRRAAAWEAAATAAEEADDPLVAVATATVAQRLADRGASVVTAAKLRLDAQVARLREGPLAARLAQPWTLADGTTVVVHDLALAITPDAMVPVLRFVRPAPGDEAAVQATIDGLMSAVRERAGGLAEHFDAVLFEAYDERPVDPAVEYRAFRAARFFDPAQDPRGLGAFRAGQPGQPG